MKINGLKKLSNDGFSLIELIIALAISVIVVFSAYSFVIVGVNSYDKTSKTVDVQEELSEINNLVENTIISGKYGSTTLTTNGNIKRLSLGDKVLYYNGNTKELCIYSSSETVGTDITDHLISKYVEQFDISFTKTEIETTADPALPPEPTTEAPTKDAAGNLTVSASSDLVRIKLKVTIKGKTRKTENVYEIRNK